MHSWLLQASAASAFRISRRNQTTLWLKVLRRNNSTASNSGPELMDVSWKQLGVPVPVAAALRSVFPHIAKPTKTQAQLIPAILSGKDVLLKDYTGTGKTFGLVLAMLSDFRVWRSEHESHKKPTNPSVSTLVIVPHKDLALQLERWIQVITESKIQVQRPKLSSIVQVLAKIPREPLQERLAELERITPHILIGTPNILLKNYDKLKLHKLNTVVVDEVDYLIETVPNLRDNFKREKIRKKIAEHPGPTRTLLNKILAPRMIKANSPNPDNPPTPIPITRQPQVHHKPQLILSTATFRGHLNRFLFQKSGWLTRGDMHLVKINGMPREAEPSAWLQNATHSVLVVNRESEIRNIASAVSSSSPQPGSANEYEEAVRADGEGDAAFRGAVTGELSGADLDEETALATEAPGHGTSTPWSPGSIEAISICFAIDVSRTALLVAPSSYPVFTLVEELKGYGVDARPLDMLSPFAGRNHILNSKGTEVVTEGEGPILFVSTLANTRGLDLPELSHVFILGVPYGRVDSYTHIAGRTCRFGKAGTIVTIVEDFAREFTDGEGRKERRVMLNGEKIMKGILREIGIIPKRVEHFD